MKKISAATILLVVAGLFIQKVFSAEPSNSPLELAKQIQTAMTTTNVDAFNMLFDWDGVDGNLILSQKAANEDALQVPVKSVTVLAKPDNYEKKFAGGAYMPNLAVVGLIKIQYDVPGDNNLIMPYGQKGKYYYLASAVSQTPSGSDAAIKSISISVTGPGQSAATPSFFQGYYVYVMNGKENKADINGEGNINKIFPAAELKHCEVEQISTNGWIRLMISEDGKNVFDSGVKKVNEKAIYQE